MGEIVEGEVWEGRRSDGIPTIERPEPPQENGTLDITFAERQTTTCSSSGTVLYGSTRIGDR